MISRRWVLLMQIRCGDKLSRVEWTGLDNRHFLDGFSRPARFYPVLPLEPPGWRRLQSLRFTAALNACRYGALRCTTKFIPRHCTELKNPCAFIPRFTRAGFRGGLLREISEMILLRPRSADSNEYREEPQQRNAWMSKSDASKRIGGSGTQLRIYVCIGCGEFPLQSRKRLKK